jgi:hypothetical protein
MENKKNTIFGKDNIKWMLIGAAVIIIGLFLMSGGKGDNSTVFSEQEVYSKTRITVAPILIMLGLVIEIFAIMKKGSSNS